MLFFLIDEITSASIAAGRATGGAATFLDLTFTIPSTLPANGKIMLELPSILDGSSATLNQFSGIDGSLAIISSSNNIQFLRSSGTLISGDTTINIKIDGITLPTNALHSGIFPFIQTTSNSGTEIDIVNNVPSFDIQQGKIICWMK